MNVTTLMDIYYPIAFFVSWISILIWIEVNIDSDGFEFLKDPDELPLKLLINLLAFLSSFILPFVWPFIILYLLLMLVVRRIAKLIRIYIKKENKTNY